MNQYGFCRITCVSPRTAVANPAANAAEIVRVLDEVSDSDIVVYPELCVTGYTCGDLFGQSTLLSAGIEAIARIAQATAGAGSLSLSGLRFPWATASLTVLLFSMRARSCAIIPKQHLPNYKEFYELRLV